MKPIPTRYLKEVGTVHYLRQYWEAKETPCTGNWTVHDSFVFLTHTLTLDDYTYGGQPSDYSEDQWGSSCERCGASPGPTSKTIRQVFHRRLYEAPDGSYVHHKDLAPGDLYYIRLHTPEERCWSKWTNCDGRHLNLTLPNDQSWDIDSRCSNCTMREDTTHRCWIRHGLPEKGELLHVDKQGHTCKAGAGSIVVPGFHGFCHHGHITSC